MEITVSSSRTRGPALSIVLATVDSYRRIRRTVEHLKSQTICHQLELLLVASSAETLQLDEDLSEHFHAVHLIEVGPIRSLGEAKARAVTEANSDLVVFAEDHSWPDPEWARSIVDAHQQGYVAVGPRIRNANPHSTLSWANYLACFGQWSDRSQAGEVGQTPWHNTSYRRELLAEWADELGELLVVEGILQRRLSDRGLRFFLLPEISTDHVNISKWSSWIRHAYWGGRLFGGSRSTGERWSLFRRLTYILGSPLIPLLRLKRLAPDIRSNRDQLEHMPRLLAALMLSFVLHAIGEASGYALGPGTSAERYMEFEAKRFEALDSHDLVELGIG